MLQLRQFAGTSRLQTSTLLLLGFAALPSAPEGRHRRLSHLAWVVGHRARLSACRCIFHIPDLQMSGNDVLGDTFWRSGSSDVPPQGDAASLPA